MNDQPPPGPPAGRHLSLVPDLPPAQEPVPVPVPLAPGGAALSGPALEIAAGYAFAGPAIELGALVWEGRCLPDARVRMPLSALTGHGLVTGATGTGRTRTLQLLAEQLSARGVPVLLADVQGELSGIAVPGEASARVTGRATEIGQPWSAAGVPAAFHAPGGVGAGVPVRATVTSFGPVLLARALRLDEAHERSLGLVLGHAEGRGLELAGLEDLRALVVLLASRREGAGREGVGGLPRASAAAILRALSAFEAEGAGDFFGVPEDDMAGFPRRAPDGRGTVSVLDLSAVRDRPRLWSSFLVWLLAELPRRLPRRLVGTGAGAGDAEAPGLVFLLDEAHALFEGASPAFLAAVARTVRGLAAKGVGVFFVARTPDEVPAEVLGQLGNRVQHALRAFTPQDRRAVDAVARAFPDSPYDLAELLTGLGAGEAVVTVLGERGGPTPVAAVRLRAPGSRMGPLDAEGPEGPEGPVG